MIDKAHPTHSIRPGPGLYRCPKCGSGAVGKEVIRDGNDHYTDYDICMVCSYRWLAGDRPHPLIKEINFEMVRQVAGQSDDIDNRVIGGPHHREYYAFSAREYMLLPVMQPIATEDNQIKFGGTLPHETTAIHEQVYRRCRFGCRDKDYFVWIPDDVPEGREMEHVLRMALKASKP
jgi:hypothetical protein